MDRGRRRGLRRLPGDRARAGQRPRLPVPDQCREPRRRVTRHDDARHAVHQPGGTDRRTGGRRVLGHRHVDRAGGRRRAACDRFRGDGRADGHLPRGGERDPVRADRPPGGARLHLHRAGDERGRRERPQRDHAPRVGVLGPRTPRRPRRRPRQPARPPDVDAAAAGRQHPHHRLPRRLPGRRRGGLDHRGASRVPGHHARRQRPRQRHVVRVPGACRERSGRVRPAADPRRHDPRHRPRWGADPDPGERKRVVDPHLDRPCDRRRVAADRLRDPVPRQGRSVAGLRAPGRARP